MRQLGRRREIPQVKGMPLVWHGVACLITAIPAAVLLTMLWNIILGMLPIALPETEYLPAGYAILAMLPMFLAPLVCVWGIIRSFKYRGAPGVMACGIMAAIGLVGSLILCFVFYMVTTGQVV